MFVFSFPIWFCFQGKVNSITRITTGLRTPPSIIQENSRSILTTMFTFPPTRSCPTTDLICTGDTRNTIRSGILRSDRGDIMFPINIQCERIIRFGIWTERLTESMRFDLRVWCDLPVLRQVSLFSLHLSLN